MVQLKKKWEPGEGSFRQLLFWLDEGGDSAGEKYLEVRRRLELYFDRKNCLEPEELADETLNRVARKLSEVGTITNVTPLHYCYITAKFVFLESLRDAKRLETRLPDSSDPVAPGSHPVPATRQAHTDDRDKLASCLDQCLLKLPVRDREIILEYYQGQQRAKIERRSALARRLSLTPNALTIRACRIRRKLEVCVTACAQGADRF
jgi:DNA-directed RNA polymerase specialized sigma24 family protein